jgi:ABC-type antimicrobial peptide transport system permease subunit
MNRGVIVGVAGDVRQAALNQPAVPEIYFPATQNWSQLSELGMSLVVRTVQDPLPIVDAVRTVIADVDPELAVFNVKTMDRIIADSLAPFTAFLWLIGAFAGLALMLAVVGISGVVAEVAAARRREFAIRMALGADRNGVTRLVALQGATLTGIGLIGGLAGAVAARPLLDQLPIGVSRVDVRLAFLVAILVGCVAIAACLVPARRAASIAPVDALRAD